MTNSEFSDTFTTLLSSYNTQAQFGEQASKREIVLDEYEKSVFLTQAQDIVIKSYFDGTLNQQGQGFDDSARRQMDFSPLIKVAELSPAVSGVPFDDRGIVYQLPTDVLFILNEKLTVKTIKSLDPTTYDNNGKGKGYVIVPISYKEYNREMSKPYAQPLKKQAWRLFQNMSAGFDINSELIPRWNIVRTDTPAAVGDTEFIYKIRYVKRPRPIILEDLPNELEIDGKTKFSSCELNPIIHTDILNKAVELAIATRGGVQSPNNRSNQ